MKKVYKVFLVAAVLLFCIALLPTEIQAAGSGTCGDNLTWVLDEKGTLTISGTGAMTNYGLYDSPWYYNTSVKKIIIEDGVTTIGNNAFYYCGSLISVEIANSVTSIGDYAFAYCTSLPGVIIPDGITSINRHTFWGCHGLTTVIIPDSVTTIGMYAFSWCTSLTSITIPNSVTVVDEGAFYYSNSLSKVYYESTQAKWKQITIAASNEPLLNAEKIFTDCIHSYDNGVETKAPTCAETGIKTFACTACGASYTARIEKLTTHSYTDGTCTVCGGSDPDYVPPVGNPESSDTTDPVDPDAPGSENFFMKMISAIIAFLMRLFGIK